MKINTINPKTLIIGGAEESKRNDDRVCSSLRLNIKKEFTYKDQLKEKKIMNYINNFLEAIKLSPKHLLPIFLSSGFLLFSPKQYLELLGLEGFINQYRPWIGLIFILSFALLVSHITIQVWSWVNKKYLSRKRLNASKNRLRNLTPDEKKILQRYILKQTKTQSLDIRDGAVNGLVNENILYRSSNVGMMTIFDHNIQPWAWEFLNKNKDLISLSEE